MPADPIRGDAGTNAQIFDQVSNLVPRRARVTIRALAYFSDRRDLVDKEALGIG
jgi:hypothetical protein